jgi:hypothetical protein
MIKQPSGTLYKYASSVASSGGVVFHGASIATQDEIGLLFCGPSGCGKSTMAAKLEGQSCGIINDEISVVLPEKDGMYCVAPLPWNVKRPHRKAVLKEIVLLEHGRGPVNEYAPVSFPESVVALSRNTWFFLSFMRQHQACMRNIIAIAGSSRVGVLRHFLPDQEVLEMVIGR